MRKTAVLNVVGLTDALIGEHTPNLAAFRRESSVATVDEAVPAVTCTAQSAYLTGRPPADHGIVGNGWYFRDRAEVAFWRQSNRLVQAPKLWELARDQDPDFTCAKLFWWYSMYASVDIAVTPRPMYPSDGRKIPDVWTAPMGLRDAVQAELGRFPLFDFWGPRTSIASSRWIAECARWVEARYGPDLSLVYLPHLDYVLQRVGPDLGHPDVQADLTAIDRVVGELVDFYAGRDTQVVILSEYGISPVSRPVHLNRRLRHHGLLSWRDELGCEVLDPGASKAFAVADHQVAHVYVNDASRLGQIRRIVASTPGVERVLDAETKPDWGLDHPRSGELVAIAESDAWFTYYYWLDDARAPDYARTVDIHRKPGYDPVELFVDPELRLPQFRAGLRLAQKKLGMRYLMDVIGLDASVVGGSHGRPADDRAHKPLVMSRTLDVGGRETIAATAVFDVLADHLGLATRPARAVAAADAI